MTGKKMKTTLVEATPDFYGQAYKRVRAAAGIAIEDPFDTTDDCEAASTESSKDAPANAPTPCRNGTSKRQSNEPRPGGPAYHGYDYHFGEDEQWDAEVSNHRRETQYQSVYRSYRRGGRPENSSYDGQYYGSLGRPQPGYSRGRYDETSQSSRKHCDIPQLTSTDRASSDNTTYASRPQVSRNIAPFAQQYGYNSQINEDGGYHSPRTARQLDDTSVNNQHGSDFSADGVDDSGEEMFVHSNLSEISSPGAAKPSQKASLRHKSTPAGKRDATDASFLEDPAYTEDGRVIKRSSKGKGRGRGRPSAGRIINAPFFVGSLAKVQEKLEEVNPNNSGNVTSCPYRNPNWITHAAPQLVQTSTLTHAALIKRGIDPNTAPEKVSTKAKGASNPENIWIVNMKDHEGLSFEEIASRINEQRVLNGLNPDMKANAANCRYNRTAPHLYQMRGIPFVRITDRANGNGDIALTRGQEEMIWTDPMDAALAKIEKEYRVRKWILIAQRLAAQFPDEDWITEKQVAIRFQHI